MFIYCTNVFSLCVNIFFLEFIKAIMKCPFATLTSSTFDRNLEKAILYAVGNTLVCDDLDEAKALSWTGERHKGTFIPRMVS